MEMMMEVEFRLMRTGYWGIGDAYFSAYHFGGRTKLGSRHATPADAATFAERVRLRYWRMRLFKAALHYEALAEIRWVLFFRPVRNWRWLMGWM